MTRRLGPTPADDIGADLEPVWDRLALHASAAPAASPELTARVQGALKAEFDRSLRPTANRPLVVVRPLVRLSSLRSLAAAAALLALLGASVALAGAGAARLNQVPAVTAAPAIEEASPVVKPRAQGAPGGIAHPNEDDDPDGDDIDDVTDDEDAVEPAEPDDVDRPEADEDEEPEDEEPEDSPDDEPDDSPEPDDDETPEPEDPD